MDEHDSMLWLMLATAIYSMLPHVDGEKSMLTQDTSAASIASNTDVPRVGLVCLLRRLEDATVPLQIDPTGSSNYFLPIRAAVYRIHSTVGGIAPARPSRHSFHESACQRSLDHVENELWTAVRRHNLRMSLQRITFLDGIDGLPKSCCGHHDTLQIYCE